MDKTFIPEELRGKDIYKILEVSKKDINNENISHIIRRQYLKLAVKLHPDKQKGRNVKTQNSSGIDESKEKFNLVKSAYEFLSNSTLRKKYNSYILQNIKKKEPLNHNTSLKRNIDNNKFLFQRYQKEVYKNKLEEREKATTFNNKKENNFNKRFGTNGSDDLEQKIKKENEEFLRKKEIKEMKKRNKNGNNEKEKKNKAGDECKNEEELLEIYLDNYEQNIDFLENCINENYFFHFFFGFNFLDSSLNLNNEKETGNNSRKKVGFILFATRKEAIEAYLYYKKNLSKMHKQFKIKLAISCKGEKELEKEKEKKIEKAMSDNVDKKMEEMEDELEKLLS